MQFFYENKQQIELVLRSDMDSYSCMHHAVEIFYLIDGSLTVSVDAKEYTMTAGQLVTVFPDMVHSYSNCKNELGYLLIVPVELLTPYKDIFATKMPSNPIISAKELEKTPVVKLMDIFYGDKHSSNVNYKIALSQVLVGRILELYKYSPTALRYDNRIREVVTYIHEHYSENPSRKTIARAVGMNENYVSRVFSNRLHTTLVQYVRSVQIQNAAELLRNTELSVKEIAEQTGFRSLRNFNRIFLDKYGQSPRNYRKFAKEFRVK